MTQSMHCMQPSPIYSMYLPCTSIWDLSMSVPRRPKGVCMCTTQSGGWALEANTPTHAKCSHATLWYAWSPMCHTSVKILTKQTDCTCWPRSLPLDRYLAYILQESQVTYKYKLKFYNFSIVRELHVGPLLMSGKSHQHMACRSL